VRPGSDALTNELVQAVASGDLDRADALLNRISGPLPPHALAAAGTLHMRRERWARAAEALAGCPDADETIRMQRLVARNLAALQQHRPEAYATLCGAEPSDRYRIGLSRTQRPTVFWRMDDGRTVCLSPEEDPRTAVSRILEHLSEARKHGSPILLAGIGDGYLANALAAAAPQLPFNRQQVIYICEPEPALVMACLMIHDYTAADGPVVHPRFRWHIGPDWLGGLRDELFEDFTWPFPHTSVRQGPSGAAVATQVGGLLSEIAAMERKLQAENAAYYAGLSADELAAVMGTNPPRRPRALILTTRYSSVLQYSARDAAEGFAQNGWEARVSIEASDCQVLSRLTLRKQLAQFKPDLVFQINHLRHEHGDVFPPNLPFVCWIQDHMPHLTLRTTGALLRRRDFVLTNVVPTYTSLYDYPPRQCLAMPKLTRVPQRPAAWRSDGRDDIAYVSHASEPPAITADRIISGCLSASDQRLVRTACQRLMDLYQRGECVATWQDLERFLDQVQQELRLCIRGKQERDAVLRQLAHPLNSNLYRQQALHWAAQAAEALGLHLGIYGNGWEKHPTLGRHARGPVRYGPDLENLTRVTRINLQLEPYCCFTHQRLLDGLAAGGFFLIRHHPFNTVSQEFAAFLEQHLDESVRTVEQARAAIAPERRPALEDLLRRGGAIGGLADPVATVRCWQEAHLLVSGQPSLPDLQAVTFTDAQSLRVLVERYANDDDARGRVAARQRHAVEQRLTYAAGVGRVVRRIGNLISSEGTTP